MFLSKFLSMCNEANPIARHRAFACPCEPCRFSTLPDAKLAQVYIADVASLIRRLLSSLRARSTVCFWRSTAASASHPAPMPSKQFTTVYRPRMRAVLSLLTQPHCMQLQ